jgi:hypothetical protein
MPGAPVRDKSISNVPAERFVFLPIETPRAQRGTAKDVASDLDEAWCSRWGWSWCCGDVPGQHSLVHHEQDVRR